MIYLMVTIGQLKKSSNRHQLSFVGNHLSQGDQQEANEISTLKFFCALSWLKHYFTAHVS